MEFPHLLLRSIVSTWVPEDYGIEYTLSIVDYTDCVDNHFSVVPYTVHEIICHDEEEIVLQLHMCYNMFQNKNEVKSIIYDYIERFTGKDFL